MRINSIKLINFLVIVGTLSLINCVEVLAKDNKAELNKALYSASFYGNYESVKELIDQGADVNSSPAYMGGLTPLHKAVGLGDMAKLDLLKPPIPELVGRRLKVVRLLINKGANVNARDAMGRTPLHFTKTKEAAELLIKHGADVNAQDATAGQVTPIQTLCATKTYVGVIDTLIQHGANVDYATSETTALVLAVRGGNQEVVELLVKNGADINFSFKGKDSVLENAIIPTLNGKSTKLAEYLIARGAFLTNSSLLGYSELHWAVNQNNFDLVKTVLNYKAPVDYENQEGNTPLILAVVNNNIEIASLLITYGAEINVRSRKWNSPPLFLAKSESMVKLLLGKGADRYAADGNGNKYLANMADQKLVSFIKTYSPPR